MGAQGDRAVARAAEADRRGGGSAAPWSGAVSGDRPGRGGAAGCERVHRCPGAAERLRSAPDLDPVHPVQPVPGGTGDGPGAGCRTRRPAQYPCACARWSDTPGQSRPPASAGDAADGQSPGSVPGRHRVLQSRCGHLPGASGGRHRAGSAAAAAAGGYRDPLPGRGAGLPGVTGQQPVADPGGDPDHVHSAGVLYESTIHPLTILSTLPSATVGALLALLLTGRALDMIAVVGVVLLIGLVKKNGIMMVDFALEAQRVQGMAPREAIHRAAMLRFRPILMTTLAALFGALPLMLASGSGAELRQPLGLVMVGGLLVSQVLTLFTTPVVYLLFDRFSRRPGPAPDVRVQVG